jgi:hypothetical protein
MSTEVIYNETGIGDLKDKTPNYNFNIPYFDIATWHDYIEENFRSIDALFHYIYEIKQYKGKWENSTSYKKDDVLFVVDKNSQYDGRLVKVLIEHTTTDLSFDEFFTLYSNYYELFEDAHAASIYALEAKDAKTEAISAMNFAKDSEESAQSYAIVAENNKNLAQGYSISAQDFANSAETSANSANNSKDEAKLAADKIKLCPFIAQNVKVPASSWEAISHPSNLSVLFKQTYQYQARVVLYTHVDIGDGTFFGGDVTSFVTFEPNNVISGDFAPICYTSASYINNQGPCYYCYIYSKTKPIDEITLPSITIYWKE